MDYEAAVARSLAHVTQHKLLMHQITKQEEL